MTQRPDPACRRASAPTVSPSPPAGQIDLKLIRGAVKVGREQDDQIARAGDLFQLGVAVLSEADQITLAAEVGHMKWSHPRSPKNCAKPAISLLLKNLATSVKTGFYPL
jgi:hypothetical protein